MTEERFYYLIQVIQLIAADYEVQMKSLPDFVHVSDEIALLLDDNIFILDMVDISDFKNVNIPLQIRLLDRYLGSLNKDKFTVNALLMADEWKKARKIAQSILTMLGVDQKKPDLSWVQFI